MLQKAVSMSVTPSTSEYPNRANEHHHPSQLVECPGGTGDMQAKLKAGEIDVCIGKLGILFLELSPMEAEWRRCPASSHGQPNRWNR